MFTGIITDLGRLKAREKRGDTRMIIATSFDTASIAPGASIACDGACLTVVDKGPDWIAVDVSAETLSRTKLGDLRVNDPINLERSLKVGDELGGHIVTGHVDAVGEVVAAKPAGDSLCLEIAAPADLMRFISPKGALTVNGASLTVNEVSGNRLTINLIPYTREKTNLGQLTKGSRVNLEIDVLARYLARLLATERT